MVFAVDLSLTVLSERVHRGSLANARSAIAARHAHDLGADRAWREIEDRFDGPAATFSTHPAESPRRPAPWLALVEQA